MRTPPGRAHGSLVLTPHSLAVGGDAIAHDVDGRVVFVDGALPGDEVEVRLVAQKSDYGRAVVHRILRGSHDRVAPSCPHVAQRCGGCGWQHVAAGSQATLKWSMVVDALRRTGRIDDAASLVTLSEPLATRGHRTTVRAAVVGGRAGYRAGGSHEVVPVDSCEVAHPVIERVLTHGSFGALREVTIRVGTASGDLLVIGDPNVRGIQLPELDDDRWRSLGGRTSVVRVGDESAFVREVVDGVTFRVSAGSFFQTRPDGAQLLVSEVRGALAGDAADVLVDLYGGVGLFAATVGRTYATVLSVEQHRRASDDAVVNLAHLRDAEVVHDDVDRWRPRLGALEGREVSVVADPSRRGLGRGGVATIAALRPRVAVLISCDAGALGRDVRLLRDAGFEYDGSVLVDLFPQTPHVEVVSRFVRSPG